MTKLFDETRTVEITMREWDNRYNEVGLDWSRDFFEVGTLEYDEERDAYRVNDVAYCVECAEDWANATGDFSDDEVPEYIERQVFVEEVEEKEWVTMKSVEDYSWAKFYGLPFVIYDGVKQFWEPGYDYDDQDFWASFDPKPSEHFIDAVKMYDWLKKNDPDGE